MTFTAVTFAPVQSFIRSSRKLRDLYGSSLLLSHLARALHDDAIRQLNDQDAVISPAEVDATRGVPNTLLIQGDYARQQAESALLVAWGQSLEACRTWLETTLQGTAIDPGDWEQGWGASWKACKCHSWELFHGQGNTIAEAQESLSCAKQRRAWEIPNWTGESSTLSSVEAIVRPRMAEKHDPRFADSRAHQQEARAFLETLRAIPTLGEAFAGTNEEISLTELVKRLVTYRPIANKAFHGSPGQLDDIIPSRFRPLGGGQAAEVADRSESIVWFMADGDQVGDHLRQLSGSADEVEARRTFSREMRSWAASLYREVPEQMGGDRATVVYAGGDDLFGALHESRPGLRDLSRDDLFQWLRLFPQLWQQNGQANLTASMGLVWADSQVPQREALQHARDAEAAAKARGRDRFALRLLYAGGNHLQWTCPWGWFEAILSHYRDREGRRSGGHGANAKPGSWRHLAEDLIWLQERHAIGDAIHLGATDAAAKTERSERAEAVAKGLFEAYFPGWAPPPKPEVGRRLDQWLIDLGLVMAGLERWRDCRRPEEEAA